MAQYQCAVSALLEHGANPSLATSFENSPLAIAMLGIDRGSAPIIKLLVKNGAFYRLEEVLKVLKRYKTDYYLGYIPKYSAGAQEISDFLHAKHREMRVRNSLRDTFWDKQMPEGVLSEIAEFVGSGE